MKVSQSYNIAVRPFAPELAVGAAGAPAQTDPVRELHRLATRPSGRATSVVPLRDGAQAWQARFDHIASARRSVVVNMYCIEPDEAGFAYIEALIAAQRRGAQVVLTLDAIPMIGFNYLGDKKSGLPKVYELFKQLEEAGGFVAWTGTFKHQVGMFGAGNHFKNTVVDGQSALIGGRNIGGHFIEDWTDYDAIVTGPIAAQLGAAALEIARDANPNARSSHLLSGKHRRAFRDTIAKLTDAQLERSQQLDRDQVTRSVRGQPLGDRMRFVRGNIKGDDRNDNAIRAEMIACIDRAERSLVLSSNYFNPHPELFDAIERAAQRGVDVTIVTTGLAAVEFSGFPYYNTERTYPRLRAAGIRIMETTVHEHGKMMLIDDSFAAFGSYNPELSADHKLVEGMLFSDSPTLVASVRESLNDTIDNRSAPAPAEPRQLNFGQKVQRFFAWVLRWSI